MLEDNESQIDQVVAGILNSYQQAGGITDELLRVLPDIRARLHLDIQASLDGDPAAKSEAEVILGGETVIGHHSIIGGNVWLVRSVPPYSRVYNSAVSSEPIVEPTNDSAHFYQI